MRNRILLWSALLYCSLSQAARPGEDEQPRPEDVKLLQAAGVASDGPALLEFFQKRTVSDKQPGHIQELIKELGASDYPAREEASKQLIDLGHVAVPALQQALQDMERLFDVMRQHKLLQSDVPSPNASV